MSYDIYLHLPDSGEACLLPEAHHMKGGTYQVGGTKKAEFNITYNYAKIYYAYFGENGIRTIYGMTGAKSIPLLEDVISKLGDNISPDYWEATEGNAKVALLCLLTLARECPEGIWAGD